MYEPDNYTCNVPCLTFVDSLDVTQIMSTTSNKMMPKINLNVLGSIVRISRPALMRIFCLYFLSLDTRCTMHLMRSYTHTYAAIAHYNNIARFCAALSNFRYAICDITVYRCVSFWCHQMLHVARYWVICMPPCKQIHSTVHPIRVHIFGAPSNKLCCLRCGGRGDVP